MGMYTELAIGVSFKEDTPDWVIDIINQMTSEEVVNLNLSRVPESHQSKKLFFVERPWMLRSGGSYYFDAEPCLVWKKDPISLTWQLTVWTNIKNYSSEWEYFLEFIQEFLESRGFIGHYRYEEDDNPTLLYNENGVIKYKEVKFDDSEPHS